MPVSGSLDRMVLRFREVLQTTERLEQGELASYQQSLLAQLLQHTRRNVPYYRDRLSPVFRGAEIDFSRWREIPVLTRAEAQKGSRDLAARVLPPHAGKVEREVTSGSTGRPLDHLKNELMVIAGLGLTDRVYRWWRLDGNRTLATFTSRRREAAPPPDGITSPEWRSGFPKGKNHIIDMWADTDVQLDWLLARRPSYLTAYSSTLPPLAERARERGVDLRFDKILSTATMVTDDNGSPCRPGETGRVIVTSLYNYAMPFIRYEIGDYATVGDGEPCRIKLSTLSRVLGRYRNTFTLADGRIIYPYVAIERFRDFLSFSQVQVVQTAYDRLEIRYVAGGEERAPDTEGLEAYLRQAIDPSLSAAVVKVEEIARASSGKFEDFLSLVPRPAS